MAQKEIILSTAYFGPVQYFVKFVHQNIVIIEQFDHYIKQTYRNRCVIGSANGPLCLTVPVKRHRGTKTLVKDLKIDYDLNWRKIHHQGIVSAYGSSPFFEYLRDDIEPFFFRKYTFLIDLNTEVTNRIIDLLCLNTRLRLSAFYSFYDINAESLDFREIINPKKSFENDKKFFSQPYHQVFSTKYDFQPNLSILDLLFNKGNEAREVLIKCIKEESTITK